MITEFARASSIEEAVDFNRKGFTYLAGGTQINNASSRRWGTPIEKVVSLDALDLSGISVDDTGAVIIGSGTTLQEIADSDIVPEALRNAAGFIPTRSVRNIATIGGNIAANRPDSYIIPTLIALEASAGLAGDNSLSVEAYVFGKHSELITCIQVPKSNVCCVAVKESRSQLALPVVSAAVRILRRSDSSIARVIVAAGCVAPHVIRLTGVERGIIDDSTIDAESQSRIELAVATEISPSVDFLGSAEYKRYINSVVIADALRRCIMESGK
jgi:putative selenate reductase FAD-binding subunit